MLGRFVPSISETKRPLSTRSGRKRPIAVISGSVELGLPEARQWRQRVYASIVGAPTLRKDSPNAKATPARKFRSALREAPLLELAAFMALNKGISMTNELAAANVNRSYQLAASSIAIFTFLLFFLYPKFVSGDVDARLFHATLIVMGVAIFSFAFASSLYCGASLGGLVDDAARIQDARRGDWFWLLGSMLLLLTPSLILFTVRILVVALPLFALWLAYVLFVIGHFPRIRVR
jgi:hypothetical protein